MFSFTFSFDDSSISKTSKVLKKHRNLSRLSKREQKDVISTMNKKIGKERRSYKKRPRFIEPKVEDNEDQFDDLDTCERVPATTSLSHCINLQDVETSEPMSQHREEVDSTTNQCADGHLLLRQIFELWGISHNLTQGVGGDGWHIGSQICMGLARERLPLGEKIGTPPVRVYNTNDPKVMSIIGSVIARYLITHKR